MGRHNNFCTDEETTKRAVDWLRNGAKSRGMELEYLIGRTLYGTVINGEIPAERLAAITVAILDDLARSWQNAAIDGGLDEDEIEIAAVICAANALLVDVVAPDDEDEDDAYIKACRAIMDKGVGD